MSNTTGTFSAGALAALLTLVSTSGRGAEAERIFAEAEQKVAEAEQKAAEAEQESVASQAELERKLDAARKRLDEAARDVATLSMSLSDDIVPHMRKFGTLVGGAPRAVLGVNLGSSEDSPGDGVEIVSVSPGGAAEAAGLKAGDVLTNVNGTALKGNGDETAREKLLAAMRKVKPGEKVAVSYRRGSKVLKANLVAQPLKDHLFAMAVPGHEVGAMGHLPRFAFMRGDGVFGSAELVALTPKLGQYFGTETGLLVVRAPDDSRLKLEDGDVIVDIDGRTPSSPSHALRILSSYQAGEKLKLNILRARKRMSFEVTVPDNPWEKRLDGARLQRKLMFPPVQAMPALPAVPPPPPGDGTISIVESLPHEPA
jgi:C-terminal processing protease CtpA/Prc